MNVGIYKKARFLLSAPKVLHLPRDSGFEVAFMGYSNVGKSSTLNVLAQSKQLARVSKTPGRTQCLNVFEIDAERRLIDVPGFGFAKAPGKIRENWHLTIDAYLTGRQCLKGIVLIMDIRHPLRDFEIQMLDWSQKCGIAMHVLLNKSDKLKRGQASESLLKVKNFINERAYNTTVQLFSTLERSGLEALIAVLNNWYELT